MLHVYLQNNEMLKFIRTSSGASTVQFIIVCHTLFFGFFGG